MYNATLSRPSYGVSVNTLFAQTMTYVAGTAGLFALGAYLGRNLTGAAGLVAFIVAFVCLLAMRATANRSKQATLALLGAFGLLMGVAVSPTIVYYASADPRRCGRRAARPRCSSLRSDRPATPPAATCPVSRAPASGRCSR